MGQNRFDSIMTCRRYRLTKDVTSEYLHMHITETKKKIMVENLFGPVVEAK